MDIGKKLRDARNAAKLTQESAAELLGVSPPDRIELGDGQDLSRYSERHKNERPLFRQPRLPAEGGKNRVKRSQLSQLS